MGVGLRSCGARVGYGFDSVHGEQDSSVARRAGSMAKRRAFRTKARSREYSVRRKKRCSQSAYWATQDWISLSILAMTGEEGRSVPDTTKSVLEISGGKPSRSSGLVWTEGSSALSGWSFLLRL